jgi:large subunit ribosomal protein L2
MKNISKTKRILTKKEPEKNLVVSIKEKAGRNFSGRITTRHRGRRVKRLYRIVDFGQEKLEILGKVVALEYDPNRTAYLALIEYKGGEKRYVLAPTDLKIGDEIICTEKADLKPGNRMKIKNIPVGIQVYNIELELGKGGRFMRSAGTFAKILAQDEGFTNLELSSGEVRKVYGECFASVGQVSHPEKRFEIIGKAGSNRLKGWRPTVRGSAMNPCDHPHGGGGGKTPIGLKNPKTPWGKIARGVKTRKKKWTDRFILQRRQNKNKQ